MGRMGYDVFSSLARIPELLTGGFLLAVIGLVASHLNSFFANYLGRGDYERTVVPVLMFKPHGRVVVLRIAIMFGGFGKGKRSREYFCNKPTGLFFALRIPCQGRAGWFPLRPLAVGSESLRFIGHPLIAGV